MRLNQGSAFVVLPCATICLSVFVALATTTGRADDDRKSDNEPLRMSKPVACTRIRGFSEFEVLPNNKLTADDKLLVYFEPSGHTIEKTKDGYRSVLSEDGQLRKKGNKDLLWRKEKMFVYEAINKYPPYRIYLQTDVSLKGFPPGEYEIDLTLHDDLAKPAETVTKTLSFTIYRPEEPKTQPKN